jgi:hypothetical protein
MELGDSDPWFHTTQVSTVLPISLAGNSLSYESGKGESRGAIYFTRNRLKVYMLTSPPTPKIEFLATKHLKNKNHPPNNPYSQNRRSKVGPFF